MQNAVNHIAAACEAAGIHHAVICPGSRNAPLIMAFTRHPGVKCVSVIDERSAGFIALGMAQRSGLPVALICTSGSAVANFYPAVLEAFYQRIPLVVITADRPPELIDQWDGQAIHQPGIFGVHVKGSYNLPDNYDKTEEFSRVTIEAIKQSYSKYPGPVHINVPLREPLYDAVHTRPAYPEIPEVLFKDDEPVSGIEELQKAVSSHKKILIVIGWHTRVNGVLPNLLEKISAKIPVITEPLSNISTRDITNADVFLSTRNEKIFQQLQPEVLITLGTSVVSKNLKLFLRKYKPKYHFHISDFGEPADPFHTSPRQVTGWIMEVFEAINTDTANITFAETWRKYSRQVAALTGKILDEGGYNEMTVVNKVMQALPRETYLQLANSMAIRWAGLAGTSYLYNGVYANRGVAGIDGCTSTAEGMAYMEHELRKNSANGITPAFITLITGDVAFFYDSNALWNNFVTPNLRIVVLNNGGGGIFRLIDGPGQMPELEEFVETKHTRTAELVAKDYNVGYTKATNFDELEAALKTFYEPSDRPKILEIITDSKITAEFFKKYKQLINELE